MTAKSPAALIMIDIANLVSSQSDADQYCDLTGTVPFNTSHTTIAIHDAGSARREEWLGQLAIDQAGASMLLV